MSGVESVLNASKEKINEIFSRYDVIFAYLFGSQLSAEIGRLSDVDIAIYFDEALTKQERFNRMLKIGGELSSLLKRDDIDIVVLNDAYPLLAHRVIKQGKVIFSSDEKKRIDFEIRAVMNYLDFKPLLEYTRETLYGR